MTKRDQRASNARYYQRNRERELARVRTRQDATLQVLRDLRRRPCADCAGVFEPHQMDFDHRDGSLKSFRLTSGRVMLTSRSRLLEEAAKCDIVCANCHRIRTKRRFELVRTSVSEVGKSAYLGRKRRAWRDHARLLDRLKGVPCDDCGGEYPAWAMDFDHRDPSNKRYTVSRMVGRAGVARIMAEVAKCDIVCANCHRARTYARREASSP